MLYLRNSLKWVSRQIIQILLWSRNFVYVGAWLLNILNDTLPLSFTHPFVGCLCMLGKCNTLYPLWYGEGWRVEGQTRARGERWDTAVGYFRQGRRPVAGSAPDLSTLPRDETPLMPLTREGVRDTEVELIPTTHTQSQQSSVRSMMTNHIVYPAKPLWVTEINWEGTKYIHVTSAKYKYCYYSISKSIILRNYSGSTFTCCETLDHFQFKAEYMGYNYYFVKNVILWSKLSIPSKAWILRRMNLTLWHVHISGFYIIRMLCKEIFPFIKRQNSKLHFAACLGVN